MKNIKINQAEGISERDKERTSVTVLGLGPMGQSIARTFLKNGHPTTVWNRTAEKAKNLVKQGAVLAGSITDAVQASPLIVICVLDYDAVHAILKPVEDDLNGRTLVNLTADSPKRARETAIWASEHGIDYLDGAIMIPSLGNPSALILYSGTEEAFKTYHTTLASLGGTADYLGSDPGRAAAYDVSLLDLFWTSMIGYIHALAVAKTENIAAKDIVGYAQRMVNIFPGVPEIMSLIADEVDTGHYPGDESNIISAKVGIDHIIHTAQSNGIDVSVLSSTRAIAQKAIDDGQGTDGFTRLVEVLLHSKNH
ncbi:NAD(P)-dependent oxidoreductase [Paenibacillus nasutitermitis]|uniref:6-phosphogluconate dehydrogenase n=1 Tax=Paenibacillus nasutitermitis TaxID=1652958 RepID=A0A916Z834_9BACL|nr:NAD(P)-binding domain-containing protein [Paenibacillus nasutitermitis]GGD78938.1 6-phosphogluconate dehydrogenase [Paenibacillus nasutitermitis]